MFSSSLPDIDKKFLIKTGVILLMLILLQISVSEFIGEEVIREWVEAAEIRAPLMLIAYKTLSVVVAPLSGSVMYLVAGGLFGVWRGTLYAAIGNLLGMTLAYWIGRQYGEQAIRTLVGPKSTEQLQHLLEHLQDKKKFVLMRIVLMPLEDFINFACGMARVNYWWFISVSMVIVTVLSLFVAFLGDSVM